MGLSPRKRTSFLTDPQGGNKRRAARHSPLAFHRLPLLLIGRLVERRSFVTQSNHRVYAHGSISGHNDGHQCCQSEGQRSQGK